MRQASNIVWAIIVPFMILCSAHLSQAQSQNDAYELRMRLQAVNDSLLVLKKRKEAYQEIYQELDEIELIYNGIRYEDSTALFTNLFNLLTTIETGGASTDINLQVRNFYQTLDKINRANKNTYQPLQIKFADLWKYQNAEATTAQKFIDSELQKFRDKTQADIEVDYDIKAIRLPPGPEFLQLAIDPNFVTSEGYTTIRQVLDGRLLEQLKERSSENDFNILSRIYEKNFKIFRDALKINEQQLDKEIELASETLTEYQEEKEKVDKSVWNFLLSLMVFIIVLLLVPILYKKDSVTRIYFAKYNTIYKLACVITLIVMIFILGISGILESQAIATLFGAISTYVLKEGIDRIKDKDTSGSTTPPSAPITSPPPAPGSSTSPTPSPDTESTI